MYVVYTFKKADIISSGFFKNKTQIIKIENSYSKLEIDKKEGETLLKSVCVYSPKVP